MDGSRPFRADEIYATERRMNIELRETVSLLRETEPDTNDSCVFVCVQTCLLLLARVVLAKRSIDLPAVPSHINSSSVDVAPVVSFLLVLLLFFHGCLVTAASAMLCLLSRSAMYVWE